MLYSTKQVQADSDIQLTGFAQEQCAREGVEWKGIAISIQRHQANDGHAASSCEMRRRELQAHEGTHLESHSVTMCRARQGLG